MTVTTPITRPFNAQTTATEVVAGIAQPSMTVRTISGSHSPGSSRAAVTASLGRASANVPNMGRADDVVDYLIGHGGETTRRGHVVRRHAEMITSNRKTSAWPGFR
jgi:hypothetical protein